MRQGKGVSTPTSLLKKSLQAKSTPKASAKKTKLWADIAKKTPAPNALEKAKKEAEKKKVEKIMSKRKLGIAPKVDLI